MKRWTVMLIPHGQGNTKSLNLYVLQLYGVVLVFAVLSFMAAFSYQSVRAAKKDIERLEREKREIGAQAAAPLAPPAAAMSDDERSAIEQKIRDEYDKRMATISGELSELYDVEKNFRKNNGLPPRTKKPAGYVENVTSDAGGKGGPPSSSPGDEAPSSDNDSLMRPPSVIDGLANPSADLIVQEIEIRTQSLREYNEAYLAASEEKRDKIDRTPGNWPVASKTGVLTSEFGYRKDPFTRDLSFHDGVDIGAPYGSPVIATGKGKIISSGWDTYLGNCVRVDHGNGTVTVYGHLQKTSVSVGDVVAKGTEVGKLGSTGRSTGAHVHYEVRINGKAVDPRRYLSN